MSKISEVIDNLEKEASPPGSFSEKEREYVRDRLGINLFSPTTFQTVEKLKKDLSES